MGSQQSTSGLDTNEQPDQRILKSTNGQGVKNSRKQASTTTTNTDPRICFRCKQPGHLKKDCPELPYCYKCRTRGNVPAKFPTKRQRNNIQDKRCKSYNGRPDERNETQREEWKKAQDQPQFSKKQNRCLACAGDHNTHDCPTRCQPQAAATSNRASSSGIHNNQPTTNTISNSPHQQHLHNSQSTVKTSTPTLMVNNSPDQTNFRGQSQHNSPHISPLNQQLHCQQTSSQFNQQSQQPTAHQVSSPITQ